MERNVQDRLRFTLQQRFEANMSRHPHLNFDAVFEALTQKDIAVLAGMEETGGEPDMVERDGAFWLFADLVKETPKERASLCYDQEALLSRKKNPPRGSAAELARQIGSRLLTQAQYRYLQTLEAFDEKTSSWILTPEEIRRLGGALFCDRRYGHVFTYHNGADSYYGVRGFRTWFRPEGLSS